MIESPKSRGNGVDALIFVASAALIYLIGGLAYVNF